MGKEFRQLAEADDIIIAISQMHNIYSLNTYSLNFYQ